MYLNQKLIIPEVILNDFIIYTKSCIQQENKAPIRKVEGNKSTTPPDY